MGSRSTPVMSPQVPQLERAALNRDQGISEQTELFRLREGRVVRNNLNRWSCLRRVDRRETRLPLAPAVVGLPLALLLPIPNALLGHRLEPSDRSRPDPIETPTGVRLSSPAAIRILYPRCAFEYVLVD